MDEVLKHLTDLAEQDRKSAEDARTRVLHLKTAADAASNALYSAVLTLNTAHATASSSAQALIAALKQAGKQPDVAV